jgi:peptidoglycan-N-acetylglucosamine deacetylase
MAQPVFYDPRRARWRRIRTLLDVAGIILSAVIVVFIYTALREPLPKFLLPFEKHPYHALKETERDKAREKRRQQQARSTHRRTKIAPSQVELNTGEGIRAAFYDPNDAAGFSSLREYARQIDLLYPEWLHLLTQDGHIKAINDQVLPPKPYDLIENGTVHQVDDQVMPFLKSEEGGPEVFPMVNNFDGTDWVEIVDFLNDREARTEFRQEIAAFLATDRYRGLMVDFEDFDLKKGRDGFVALLSDLSQDLHAKGMKLYVSVPARNPDFPYRASADLADGLILMNYDEHYSGVGGSPGPIASQDWFTKNLVEAKKVIPLDKLICALASYGYDWPERKNGNLPQGEKDAVVSVQDAWLAARDSEADVSFDGASLNPHITYLDEHDHRHDIWFMDAVTALNQMRAARQLGIRTFALWRLGSEDRSLWKIWDFPLDASAPSKLADIPPGQDVDMEGNGDVLNIEATPTNGSRNIDLDSSTRLIMDETIDSLPEPYRVGRYGGSTNQVAISFDDGPDPQWTPQILDILKREHATGTFFLIGNQADKFPSLTKRIYDEGNEIGNHTFFHPDISETNPTLVKLELNLTESFFASRLGVRTVMFRPPYSIDAEPDTADEVRPLELTESLGYITIGDRIDPGDWRPGRTAEEVSQHVLENLPPCAPEKRLTCGNIILLHDGGGDRRETVRALPTILAGIRAKGLKIVSVADLLHKTRAEIMPPLQGPELWYARLAWIGFFLYGAGLKFIAVVFFVGDLLMTGRLLFVGLFAIYDRLRSQKPARPSVEYCPAVAVLIPAFNEEMVIERTIRSALRSTYKNLRVIVIDDGSKDRTLEVARECFGREQSLGKVLILTKPNSGKADALNFGLKHLRADEEIFIGMDADTVVAKEAVALLVPHFQNPKVGAVAGNAKVGNRVNLWTRWQALEYITSQNFERRALNTLGAVSVVPGAIGAWRVAVVRDVHAFQTDTVAEDADLTMAILRNGYRVEYEDRALAYTEAPINAKGLMRQRFRWSFGILQAVYKHREVFARKGVLGWVALPNIIVFQVLLPLVSPFIDLMFAGGAIWYGIQKHFHPESADPADFQRLVIFFLAFLIIDFITSAIAFALERSTPDTREDSWLLSQVWLQRFAYRQLFSIVLFKTVIRAIKGEPFAWDKLERTAAVTFEEREESVEVH